MRKCFCNNHSTFMYWSIKHWTTREHGWQCHTDWKYYIGLNNRSDEVLCLLYTLLCKPWRHNFVTLIQRNLLIISYIISYMTNIYLPGGVSSPSQMAGSSLMISMSSCSRDNQRLNLKTRVSSDSTLVSLTSLTFQDGFRSADFGTSSRRIL